ncbi:hypothetical protein DW125_09980 [Dorea sp. AM10-31]|nr:hypothetical protein DW125_09980 [Dorea sp. AM10-31]
MESVFFLIMHKNIQNKACGQIIFFHQSIVDFIQNITLAQTADILVTGIFQKAMRLQRNQYRRIAKTEPTVDLGKDETL